MLELTAFWWLREWLFSVLPDNAPGSLEQAAKRIDKLV
jgi:hypothetical protein